MHSHDRTLLASLGFRDPDKASPLHDLACSFLTQPEPAARLALMLSEEYRDRMTRTDLQEIRDLTNPATEVPITKGDGQYKSVIGFCDVVIATAYPAPASLLYPNSGGRDPCSVCGQQCDSGFYLVRGVRTHGACSPVRPFDLRQGQVCGEVKIAETRASDVLRQINLYRSFWHSRMWFCAVAFDPTTSFVATLKREDIRVVRLGAGFRSFVENQQNAPKASVIEF